MPGKCSSPFISVFQRDWDSHDDVSSKSVGEPYSSLVFSQLQAKCPFCSSLSQKPEVELASILHPLAPQTPSWCSPFQSHAGIAQVKCGGICCDSPFPHPIIHSIHQHPCRYCLQRVHFPPFSPFPQYPISSHITLSWMSKGAF